MDASKIGSSHVQVVRLEALLHRMKMETVGSVDAVVAAVGEAGATAHAHRSASPDSSAADCLLRTYHLRVLLSLRSRRDKN